MNPVQEAAEWRLLGLLFECPVTGWHDQVAALATEVEDPALRAAAEHAQGEATEGLYHSIFGPGGPAPAREASYQQTMQLGYLLSELNAYYDAFSYKPTAAEPPDHVAVETGFIGYLRLKEAYADFCGHPDQAATASESAQRLIEEHLSTLAEPLAKALAVSGVEYLALAGAALLRRTGPPRKAPATLPVLEDRAFDCGKT